MAAKDKLMIYGMQENGGTHLFVLAKTDPVVFGYPKVPAKVKKSASLGDALALPAIAAVAFGGFTKFNERKARVKAEEKGRSSKE
jgi:hypothetical protein